MLVTFITHAGKNIGGGHLSRCYALSQAFVEYGIECNWILNNESVGSPLAKGLKKVNFFENPFQVNRLSNIRHGDLVVVDSYIPNECFYKEISKLSKLVVIDDCADRNLEAHAFALINYSLSAHATQYSSPSCQYILGPHYALLRKEFWDLQSQDGSDVLFVAGSSDVANATSDIVEWWRPDWPRLVAVIGAFAPSVQIYAAKAAAMGKKNVEILLSPENFLTLVAKAGTVVCTASVTAYEALALNKRLVVFDVAQNQLEIGESIRDFSAGIYLGTWNGVDPDAIDAALHVMRNHEFIKNQVNPRGSLSCAELLCRMFADI